MRRITSVIITLITVSACSPSAAQDNAAIIANALEAAPASISDHAAVMDWSGTTLPKAGRVSEPAR